MVEIDPLTGKEIEPAKPQEVKIITENKPEPSFDYDDYTPSDQEILDIEKEIQDKIKERTKNG